MLYYSHTSDEPPVKCTLNTPDLSFPKQIENLSIILSGWSRKRSMHGQLINAMQLQQGSEIIFLSKTDHCHQEACREFKINMTRKLRHYGLPSAVFLNCIRRNVATY